MKIVDSESAMKAALERRYMERLRERVRSRVELEARLVQSAQSAHREFAPPGATAPTNAANKPSRVILDSFEEHQIQRHIEAQVEARLDATGAYAEPRAQSLPPVTGPAPSMSQSSAATDAQAPEATVDDGTEAAPAEPVEAPASSDDDGQPVVESATRSSTGIPARLWPSPNRAQWSRAQEAYTRWH